MKTRNLKTKTLSILLAIVMLLGMLPISVFAAEPEVVKSYHVATLYDDGTLEIFADVSNLAAIPWQNERASIKKVVFTVDTPLYTRLFSDCTNLAEITLPSTVTEIPSFCFNSCPSLASITIPDSVTSIGDRAFSGCSALESVIFGENSNLQSIGNNAFNQCDALTSITIPDSVMSIDGWAFNSCDTLTSIAIPDSVASIGERAFSDCKKLSSITFGANSQLQTIGIYAFNNCDVLESIVIPDTVTSIGGYAFNSCDALANIVIPDSVTSISNGAFSACEALASIAIPDSVTSIGERAFYNCDALASIRIPASVTSIGEDAFYGCGKLTDIYYDGTVESWNYITKGDNAIPNGVKINHTGDCVDDDTNHICDVCVAELTHGYPTEWKSDSTNHWYECTCGAKSDEAAHSYGTEWKSDSTNHWHECTCGAKTEEAAHSYGTEWKSDGTNHWRECSCGAKSGEAAHNGGTATCTEKAKCTVCTVEYGNLAEHTYGSEWKSDGTNHWHECTCEAKSDEAAHNGGTATCTEKAKCTVCGTEYSNLAEHTYGTEWKSDATNHWHECSCGAKADSAAHNGGTATCKDKAVCSTCDTAYGDLADHSYGTEWKFDGTNHWHECSCGAKSGEAAHSGGTATCKDKAVCSVCTATYGELANHTYKDGKCTVCEAADPNYVPETDSPQTGDSSNMALWIALLFISGGAIITLTVYDRKRRNTVKH